MSEYKVIQWDGKSKTLKSIIPIENAVKPSSLSTETGALVIHTAFGDLIIEPGDIIVRPEHGHVVTINLKEFKEMIHVRQMVQIGETIQKLKKDNNELRH